ncbi:MAG: 30S ribosomal protein S7 [Gammaproteobacteria bacterium GWF2_41_13]|nr:MAG: 30S ribosomal protein S7 [Gammaproteobacteria bacterium GWF2_41_13]
MARRRAAPKREILPDPKFGSELVARFVNHVMMCGKKSTAEKIVYGALDSAFDKLKGKVKDEELPLLEEGEAGGEGSISLRIFKKSLDAVCPTVEVRSRRVGGSTYQVPVEVRPNRRIALAMRWLVDAASGRNEKTMALRLAGEIMDAFYGRGTAVKKREDTHRMAMANQAFAHFRW